MSRVAPPGRNRLLERLSAYGHSIGISSSPPGTLLYWLNQVLRLLAIFFLHPREFLRLMVAASGKQERSAWYAVATAKTRFSTAADWDPRRKLPARHWQAPPLAPWARVFFDPQEAVKSHRVERICLVFYIGLGDYLYATPAIAELRRRLPGVRLVGYVSSSLDGHNAPLVARLLACNPDIDETLTYAGAPDSINWKNYDYGEVIRREQGNPRSIVVPVLYEYDAHCQHRVAEIYRGLCLPEPQPTPPPMIHFPRSPTEAARALETSMQARLQQQAMGLVFLQLDSRSSGYVYPHVAKVAGALARRGHVVLVAGSAGVQHTNIFEIDPRQIPIEQTFRLLAALKDGNYPVRIISVTSVFWPASSALGIANLTMQHRHDPGVASLWYPNLWVMTDRNYPGLPPSRQIVCPREKFVVSTDGLISYDPDFLLEVFENLSSSTFHEFTHVESGNRPA